jgi:hypothetical protein
MVLQRYLPDSGLDLSRIFILVGPQTEHNPVRVSSLTSESLCFIFVYWTRDGDYVATVYTGSIQEVPD